MLTEVQPLPWQARALGTPIESDVGCFGGRGGGKSDALLLLILQYLVLYPYSRGLLIRRTFGSLLDVESRTLQLFIAADSGARYNSTQHIWRFSNGSTCELGYLDCERDFSRYQGRNYQIICVDELGQFGEPRWIDLLRSSLRARPGQPVRMCFAGNPGGPGSAWIARRYVLKGEPWQPFTDEASGKPIIVCPSVFTENVHIDAEQYRRELTAACSGDQAMLQAWLAGDWSAVRGAYFSGVWDPNRCVINPWTSLPGEVPQERLQEPLHSALRRGRELHRWPRWRTWLCYDHGCAAPAACLLLAHSPGDEVDGVWFVKNSVVVVDELVTNVPGSLNEGLQWTVPRGAEGIRRMCDRWGAAPYGAADPAIFAKVGHQTGSIGDEFTRCGIHFEPAPRRERVHGWEKLRRLLAGAGSTDQPGLYITRGCHYLLETLPFASRDPRDPEDIDSSGPDHALDALRYGVLHEPQVGGGQVKLRWANS